LLASALAGSASARCQVGANGLGDGDGTRYVEVDTDRIGPRDVVSSHTARLAFSQGTQAPCRRIAWILGVMFARDDEATLGIVAEIGVVFGDEGMTAAPVYLLVQRPFAEQRHLVDIGSFRHSHRRFPRSARPCHGVRRAA
jgi:hypothetical protein